METIEFNTAALDGFGAIMSYAEKQMNRHPARKPRPAGVSQPLINSIRKRLIDLDPVLMREIGSTLGDIHHKVKLTLRCVVGSRAFAKRATYRQKRLKA